MIESNEDDGNVDDEEEDRDDVNSEYNMMKKNLSQASSNSLYR